MTVTVIINGQKLDLTDVDFTDTPEEIMHMLTEAIGMEIDPDFNGTYTADRIAY